jgi:hypothetical protein
MSKWKLLPIGVLALGLGYAPAEAGPAPMASTAVSAPDSGIVKVYRRGRGVGIGLGIGVLGGLIIANEAYRPRRGYYYDDYAHDGPYYYPSGYQGDPRVMCAENFRSFEWRTGLYTTYSGEKLLCPYLN